MELNMLPKIDLTNIKKVYIPSRHNHIRDCIDTTLYEDFPKCVGDMYFTLDGRKDLTDTNPTIFPATKEWYEILKLVYPNLEEPLNTYQVLIDKTLTTQYEIDIKAKSPDEAEKIAEKMFINYKENFKQIGVNSSFKVSRVRGYISKFNKE